MSSKSKKSQVSKDQFNKSQTRQLARSSVMVTALHEVSTPESNALATQIVNKADEATQSIEAANAGIDTFHSLGEAARLAEKGLKQTTQATYAAVGQLDPPMLQKLPNIEELSVFDPVSFGRKVVQVLQGGNAQEKALADILDGMCTQAAQKQQAHEQAIATQTPVVNGSVALTELKVLCLQGEILVRQLARPGSPAYDSVFKKKAKKKAAPAAGSSATSSTGAHSGSPTGASTGTSASTGSVSQPVTAPAAGSTSTPIAPMVNGVANGAATHTA
jgi:hypothetical protein